MNAIRPPPLSQTGTTNKLARGTFPATFFLACLAALELDGVALEEIIGGQRFGDRRNVTRTQTITVRIAAAEMAQIPKTIFSSRVRRMLGLDLHGWEQAMLVSLGFAALAAIAVVAATAAVIRLQRAESNTAKQELDIYKVDAAAKVAAAEAAGKAASAEAAKAQAEIEEAKARQREAELKLEQLRERIRPRRINGAQFVKILEGKPKIPVEILFVRDDPDCFQLSMQIRDVLKQAKWDVKEPRAIESTDMTPRVAQYTSTMGVGGQPHGVTVVMRATSQADFDREIEKDPLAHDAPVDTPRKALLKALQDSLGSISGGISYDAGIIGALLVVVGPKYSLN